MLICSLSWKTMHEMKDDFKKKSYKLLMPVVVVCFSHYIIQTQPDEITFFILFFRSFVCFFISIFVDVIVIDNIYFIFSYSFFLFVFGSVFCLFLFDYYAQHSHFFSNKNNLRLKNELIVNKIIIFCLNSFFFCL